MMFKYLFLIFFISVAESIRVFTIGDSHSRWTYDIFSECKENVNLNVRHIGPKLMNSVGRDGFGVLNMKSHGIVDGDIVVLSFGEIDARTHVHIHHSAGVVNEIKRLVSAYFAVIKSNVDQYQKITVWIQGVVPPTDADYNPEFPYRGALKERLLYTTLLNYYLKLYSEMNGYKFIDIFNDYVDNWGSLIRHLSDGGVHIRIYTSGLKQNVCKLLKEA